VIDGIVSLRHARAVSAAIAGTVMAAVMSACAQPAAETILPVSGPYLGQPLPGDTAELFAPGIVSTGMYTRDIAMTPDGTEIYFGVLVGPFATIMETHIEGDRWTVPEVAPFARDSRFNNLEPAISPDGQRFFFLSTRTADGRTPEPDEIRTWANQDIWVMDRIDGGWSEPYNPGPPINTEQPEFFPSITRDGTVYFTREPGDDGASYIYRSRFVNGRYQEAERLGPEVNSTANQYNAFIAPDESFLIVCTPARDDGLGGTDYYVAFRNDDDTWSGPVNLGDAVNTPGTGEYSPSVSRDGRFFFFMSTRPGPADGIPDTLSRDYLLRFRAGPESGNPAIYWMNASFIETLRPQARSSG
jgi:hypothetical protein